MNPTPRRCDRCGADAEQNYLRMTKCLDGELRRLCEWCSIDIEREKQRIKEEEGRKRAS